MGVSTHLGKNIKSTKHSAVRDHVLVRNNGVSFKDFSIARESFNTSRLATVKQSIWIIPFGVILLRRITFVTSRHFIAPKSPLISEYQVHLFI